MDFKKCTDFETSFQLSELGVSSNEKAGFYWKVKKEGFLVIGNDYKDLEEHVEFVAGVSTSKKDIKSLEVEDLLLYLPHKIYSADDKYKSNDLVITFDKDAKNNTLIFNVGYYCENNLLVVFPESYHEFDNKLSSYKTNEFLIKALAEITIWFKKALDEGEIIKREDRFVVGKLKTF